MSYFFWEQANRNLISKTLSEIHFEQLIEYVSIDFQESSSQVFSLQNVGLHLARAGGKLTW